MFSKLGLFFPQKFEEAALSYILLDIIIIYLFLENKGASSFQNQMISFIIILITSFLFVVLFFILITKKLNLKWLLELV